MEKIFFQTHGCSANFGETEIMMGLLDKANFEIVKTPEEADVIILNVCTVKGDDGMFSEYRKIKINFPNKKLIVAGCVTKKLRNDIRDIDDEVTITNTDNITHIVEAVEETINDNPVDILDRVREDKVGLPRIRINPKVGIIPILNSCLGACTFCSTKIVKGALKSYPMEAIVSECRQAVRKGCTELYLTSQDNACYMMEKGKSQLSELLRRVLEIPGEYRVRLGMANPEHILPIMDELIEVMKHENMYKFIHIPVQAGNNDILKAMRRGYTVEDFTKIIAKFRKEIPYICISTDVICGFPGESEEQFEDTINLIKKTMPEIVNISKFRRRPGTGAAKMEQLPTDIVKDRSVKLTKIFTNISMLNNEKWHNWEGNVLITEAGKSPGQMLGRNLRYKQIIIHGEHKIGDFVRVKIIKTGVHDITGVVIENKIELQTY